MQSEKNSQLTPHQRAPTDKAVPGGQTTLERRFSRAQADLSDSREKLLLMILQNPEDTFFLSSRDLAKRYKVDGRPSYEPFRHSDTESSLTSLLTFERIS